MSDARERILEAAEARLLAGGPTQLVLDAVATDAGVSKGGLLYHFASKEALVAGLCERMLAGFDRSMDACASGEERGPGAWTRAYLSATVTDAGEPADHSARLMAGILATLGSDSAHLEGVRKHFAGWHDRLSHDGIDEHTSTIVRLAADGLWLSALLGLPGLDARTGPEVIRALRAMTKG